MNSNGQSYDSWLLCVNMNAPSNFLRLNRRMNSGDRQEINAFYEDH